VLDAATTIADERLTYSEGPIVADVVGTDVDVPAGLYLIKVSEDAGLTPTQTLPYDLRIAHACEADDFDFPDVAVDQFFEGQQEPVALPLDEPVARRMCGVDVDLVPVEVLFEGQVVIIFGGTVGRDLTVELFTIEADGTESPVAANRIDDEAANTLSFAAEVLPGLLFARVTGPGIVTTGEYTWTVTLPGLEGAPENDTCATAVVLTPGVSVSGRTIGGSDDFTGGNCNGQVAGEVASDVFYRFTLPEPSAVVLDYTARFDYGGSLGLYRLPAAGCPANPASLVPVTTGTGFDAGDVCLFSFSGFERFAELPAGDYVIIVDDQFDFLADAFESGLFDVRLDVFPEGFSRACEDANVRDIELAAAGTVSVIEVVESDFFVGELEPFDDGEAANCTTAEGDELAFRFTATETGTITVRTFDDDFDTVLMLRSECRIGDGEVCDDDGDDEDFEFDSFLTAPVVAGTTYFLILDSFGSGAGATSLDLVVNP